MHYFNLKTPSQKVDFETAVRTGLGQNGGLFFPEKISPVGNIEQLLELDGVSRNRKILAPFVEDNIDENVLKKIVSDTFAFPAKLTNIVKNNYCLELFHGPTLAFKDFGANFMANCLRHFASDKTNTILTATSGDTGAAVAQAFHRVSNIRVVILFPKGKISELQQKMFTTLGDNIHTLAVDGSFDDCQQLVKQCFENSALVNAVGLNSANSINISRLLAQVCYYFDAFAQLPADKREKVVVAVPSGNFGNLCAGVIARTLGLTIKRFIACTNANDTVPRYLQSGEWSPKETIATLSNAMDVSKPNNWPRIEYLIESGQFSQHDLSGLAVSEQQTENAMLELAQQEYTSEPHAAVAYHALTQSLEPGEVGLFLGTAHPAKFKSSVDTILETDLPLPDALADCADKTDLSHLMAVDQVQLEEFLSSLK